MKTIKLILQSINKDIDDYCKGIINKLTYRERLYSEIYKSLDSLRATFESLKKSRDKTSEIEAATKLYLEGDKDKAILYLIQALSKE